MRAIIAVVSLLFILALPLSIFTAFGAFLRTLGSRFRFRVPELRGQVALDAAAEAPRRSRQAPGPPPQIKDTVVWSQILKPTEPYRIVYIDRHGERSNRAIELSKIGVSNGMPYFGVFEAGHFKTFRADRVLAAEPLFDDHAPSLVLPPTYRTFLPPWTGFESSFRIRTTAAGTRTWGVDLNHYSCTCPESRIRAGMGYVPGQLGHVCPHIARAILDHQAELTVAWDPLLLAFLADPTKTHVENLT